MKAAIYLRVSSDDQAQHGYSLAAQRTECRERAQGLGAEEVVEFADEGVSSAVLDRPGLNALRAAVRRREVGLVVIYDPDRFARNLSHQLLVTEEMEKAGVRLEFVNFEWKNTAEGKLFYSLRGAIAEYEREKIRLRTMSGRTQKAREGKLPFGSAPYGYRYIRGRAGLEIDEGEAEVVRRIFEEFVGLRHGLNGIALRLTADGIPTGRGRPAWHRQVVRQMVRNTVYMGVHYANRHDMSGVGTNRFRPAGEKVRVRDRDRAEWIPVRVPAVIDEDTWRQAQALMAEAAARWRLARSPYLLSGLVRCALCGQTMTGRRQRNWGKAVAVYTCRKTTAGTRLPGCGRIVRACDLEGAVWERVAAWLHRPEKLAELLRPRAEADAVRTGDEIARGEEDLRRVRGSQRELLTVLERGLVEPAEVLAGLDRLRRRERGLLARIGDLRADLESAREGGERDEAADTADAERWLARAREDLPLERRREILRQFVTAVAVGEEAITIRARAPSPPADGGHGAGCDAPGGAGISCAAPPGNGRRY